VQKRRVAHLAERTVRPWVEILDEWIETIKRDGKPLPPPTAGRNVAEKIA